MAESRARSEACCDAAPMGRGGVAAMAAAFAAAAAVVGGGAIALPAAATARLAHAVNVLFNPPVLLPLCVAALLLALRMRRTLARPAVFGALSGALAAAFAAALSNAHFRTIAAAPDNVAIILMVVLTGFFVWHSLRKAVHHDACAELGLKTREQLEAHEKVHTWPDLVTIEFICSVMLFALLILWSVFLKAPLEEPANPSITPNPSKAPWYFVGLQEMLVYFDPWLAGVVIPALIIAGLIAIPYIDTNPAGCGRYCWRERRFAITTFLFGFLILWLLLIQIGTFLRGPGWNFFGPFESWDKTKAEPMTNRNLSDLFWWGMLGRQIPANAFVRELPGLVFLLLYYAALPWLMRRTVMKRFREEMGAARFAVLMFLLLTMGLLPLKMILRWTIGLKYILAIPEWALNV